MNPRTRSRFLLGFLVLASGAALAAGDAPLPEVLAQGVSFNSQRVSDKRPFGAVPAGTEVAFTLHGPAGIERVSVVIEKRRVEGDQTILEYAEVARVPMTAATGERGQDWTARYRFSEPSVYGYYFALSWRGEAYVYQNNLPRLYWGKEPGRNGLGILARAPVSSREISRFRHTVYRPDFSVPDWAADAVYYYIFPERFRNGDPAHLPNPAVDTYHGRPVTVHHRWLDLPWKPGKGVGSGEDASGDFFGGDLTGIIEKLDYIADLGANALYINPVFRSGSNHKYDTADYLQIDPHFGTNEDFVRLCREAARRGIRVIPDTSINHTGSESVYFDRYGNYGGKGAFSGGRINPDSPYRDWYTFYPDSKDPAVQYKGWAGYDGMPEVNKASPSFRAFVYGAPNGVMQTWLDRGASGWRMDVAPWVPDDFWREWRLAVKRHSPEALTIAETWFDSSKFFLGDEFDSTMNYIFRNAVLDFAKGSSAADAYRSLDYIREVYPPQVQPALMNLLSSHDVARTLYVFGYRDASSPEAAQALAKQRLLLAVLFQMTYPGSPAIYYGDEVGVTGGDDPYNRATYPWPDRGGTPDTELLARFKALVKLRRDHPVFRRGSLDAPLLADEHLIVLARHLGDTWAITAFNNDLRPHEVTVTLPEGCADREFTDALSGTRRSAQGRTLVLTVPALYGTVMISP
jgi:cyclomaltodextrinase / maltogenic alpha-amylase / neopullulanase